MRTQDIGLELRCLSLPENTPPYRWKKAAGNRGFFNICVEENSKNSRLRMEAIVQDR